MCEGAPRNVSSACDNGFRDDGTAIVDEAEDHAETGRFSVARIATTPHRVAFVLGQRHSINMKRAIGVPVGAKSKELTINDLDGFGLGYSWATCN